MPTRNAEPMEAWSSWQACSVHSWPQGHWKKHAWNYCLLLWLVKKNTTDFLEYVCCWACGWTAESSLIETSYLAALTLTAWEHNWPTCAVASSCWILRRYGHCVEVIVVHQLSRVYPYNIINKLNDIFCWWKNIITFRRRQFWAARCLVLLLWSVFWGKKPVLLFLQEK